MSLHSASQLLHCISKGYEGHKARGNLLLDSQLKKHSDGNKEGLITIMKVFEGIITQGYSNTLCNVFELISCGGWVIIKVE